MSACARGRRLPVLLTTRRRRARPSSAVRDVPGRRRALELHDYWSAICANAGRSPARCINESASPRARDALSGSDRCPVQHRRARFGMPAREQHHRVFQHRNMPALACGLRSAAASARFDRPSRDLMPPATAWRSLHGSVPLRAEFSPAASADCPSSPCASAWSFRLLRRQLGNNAMSFGSGFR